MRPLRTAVVSSPARRCLQTARPIADALQARGQTSTMTVGYILAQSASTAEAELCVEPGLADWGGLFEALRALLVL